MQFELNLLRKSSYVWGGGGNRSKDFHVHPLIFKIVLYDNRKYQEKISNFSAGDLAAITALQREQTVD